MFHYDPERDRHTFELLDPPTLQTLFEAELPEDLGYHCSDGPSTTSSRLHSFIGDDFAIGFAFSSGTSASEFYAAVENHKPRS